MLVTRSRYYAWRNKLGDAPDDKKTARRIKECFWLHRRRYGSRRIAAELKRQGVRIGRCRVRSEMRRQGLEAIRPKRFRPQTTDSSHSLRISPNLLLDGANMAKQPGTVRHYLSASEKRKMVLSGDISGQADKADSRLEGLGANDFGHRGGCNEKGAGK